MNTKADNHPEKLGGKPIHESDGVVTERITSKHGYKFDVTHCRHCGCRMTKPVRADVRNAQE